MTSLADFRRETDCVDALVAALLSRDGDAQHAAVLAIPEDPVAGRRVWTRTLLLLSWISLYGED